ncbi:MAG: endonuclease III [Candidatus Promineifilaceae bacterium]
MTDIEKADAIGEILEKLYPTTPTPLDHHDSYTLLIAVLMSAQSTDVRVNQVTPKLFAAADTPQKMVTLTPDEIREIIRPVGLSPRKSQAIHKLSHILLDKHGGEVPQTFEDLEALPGVGHKTASVVMNQAFGYPAFPVDTHILRLAWRWGLSDHRKHVAKTEARMKALFPEETWGKRHLQIIFFGREYCQARKHNSAECPICKQYGLLERM